MIGIIGYGRFGQLAARYLSHDADVYVCGRKQIAPAPDLPFNAARRRDVAVRCTAKNGSEREHPLDCSPCTICNFIGDGEPRAERTQGVADKYKVGLFHVQADRVCCQRVAFL